jgi:transcriptional regulator with XRE-family HTH domain/tetratricopeptide (TPR) repeat protein
MSWMADLQEFGEQLRDRRIRVLHLTQAEVAARAGLHQSSVSRIETGHHPRDKAAAVALAQAYQLTPTQTKTWLELLYGNIAFFKSGDEPESWGSRLEEAYALLERLRDGLAGSNSYFNSPPQVASRRSPSDDDVVMVVDWVLADQHRLPRAHLLVEFAVVLVHRLNEAGYYRRRLALALAAADAARELERRTIEGWLRSDAIPWTLMEKRRDFVGACDQLETGLRLADELRDNNMAATALAFLALSCARQTNIPHAQVHLERAKDMDCSPSVQMRIQWGMGELALARGRIDDAVAAYRRAKDIDLASSNGRHATVTPSFRLSGIYQSCGELALARSELTDLLLNTTRPLLTARLAWTKFELARISRAEQDYATARQYAEEAAITLRAAEESMRLNQQIRQFLSGLPR